MLFVHGWGCNHAYFAPQQAHFEKTRRTVAVDLRCHGASDALFQEYTVAGFVDDLVWQCNELRLIKPIVVGHSMGGNIALELAAQHPDLPAAIVMIDSVLFPEIAFVEAIRSLSTALHDTCHMPVVQYALSSMFLPGDDPAQRARIVAEVTATPQRVLASALDSHLIDYDATAAATACHLPVAYIGAEATMANLPRFRELCPQLRVGQTLGSGHFSRLHVPEQINAMIEGLERA